MPETTNVIIKQKSFTQSLITLTELKVCYKLFKQKGLNDFLNENLWKKLYFTSNFFFPTQIIIITWWIKRKVDKFQTTDFNQINGKIHELWWVIKQCKFEISDIFFHNELSFKPIS